MSVELVKSEIRKFLRAPRPGVLCVRGKWGVGKTYTWTQQLNAAQVAREVEFKTYSYVSLFGVNSLEELKFSVFKGDIPFKNNHPSNRISRLRLWVLGKIAAGKKLIESFLTIPIMKKFVSDELLKYFAFQSVRRRIICIDDLERMGPKLTMGEVLGLVSYLNEQRECKVVLLLNEQQLVSEAKTDFEQYLEKVIDISLAFKPTFSEASSIALTGDDAISKMISERTNILQISNIRVIRKIEGFVRSIVDMLASFDPEILPPIISSIVLFGWAYLEPHGGMSIEFLLRRTSETSWDIALNTQEKPTFSENEAAWNALLSLYGFTYIKQFDHVIIEGIKNGFFDKVEIERYASDLERSILANRANNSFGMAWSTYHDSFADNGEELINSLFLSFNQTIDYRSPLDLNATVKLFKKLGKHEQASALISSYVNQVSDPKLLNLEMLPFGSDIDDIEIRSAFSEKLNLPTIPRDFRATLLSIKDQWSAESLLLLANSPVEAYRAAFAETYGNDLRQMISNALQFNRISNADAEMRQISALAIEALKIIGGTSPLNADRVAKFGVKIV